MNEITDIEIKRLSDKKISVKYNIPIFYSDGYKKYFLTSTKIRTRLTLVNKTELPYNLFIDKSLYNFTFTKPMDKNLNKISNIIGVKKKNIYITPNELKIIFETNEITIRIPINLIIKGDGIEQKIRKWKINNLLKNL